jgi:hypothetical protein
MANRRDHHACWPCQHYAQALTRQPPACPKRMAGYPWIGQACKQYEYEPGADHAEAKGEARHGG